MFYVIIIGLLSLANVSTSYAAPPSSSSSLRSKHHHHSSRSEKKKIPVEMIPSDEMEGGAGSQQVSAAAVVGHEEEDIGEDLNHSDVDADHHNQSSNNGQSNIIEDKETVYHGSYTTSSINSKQDLAAAVVGGHEKVSGEDLNHSDVDADHHNQSSNNGQSNIIDDNDTVYHGSYTTSSVNSSAGETSNNEFHAKDAISTNYQQTNGISDEDEKVASGAGVSDSPGMQGGKTERVGSDISNEKPLGLVTTVVDLFPEYKAPMAAAVALLGVSVAIFAITAKRRKMRRTVPSLVLEDDFDDTTNTSETVTDYVLSPVAMGVTKEGIASIFRSKQEVIVNKDLSQVARTASIFRQMLGEESTTSASESGEFYQPPDDIEANDSIASSIWPDDDDEEEEETTPQVGSASLQVVGTSSPRVDTTSSRGTQIKRMCEPLAAIILLGLATIVTSNGDKQEDEIPRSMV